MSINRLERLLESLPALEPAGLGVDEQDKSMKKPAKKSSPPDQPKLFEVFVERHDPRIGIFAACAATHLMNNVIAGRPGEDDQGLMLQVAQMIEEYPETKQEVARLAECLNEAIENINFALNDLNDGNVFPPKPRHGYE